MPFLKFWFKVYFHLGLLNCCSTKPHVKYGKGHTRFLFFILYYLFCVNKKIKTEKTRAHKLKLFKYTYVCILLDRCGEQKRYFLRNRFTHTIFVYLIYNAVSSAIILKKNRTPVIFKILK